MIRVVGKGRSSGTFTIISIPFSLSFDYLSYIILLILNDYTV
jgi:hypothetical protein